MVAPARVAPTTKKCAWCRKHDCYTRGPQKGIIAVCSKDCARAIKAEINKYMDLRAKLLHKILEHYRIGTPIAVLDNIHVSGPIMRRRYIDYTDYIRSMDNIIAEKAPDWMYEGIEDRHKSTKAK